MGIVVFDYSLVTVRVVYFLPDYHDILQEFLWQTMDMRPGYPRIQRFLDYWRREIDAVIKEIDIAEINTPHNWRNGIIIPH